MCTWLDSPHGMGRGAVGKVTNRHMRFGTYYGKARLTLGGITPIDHKLHKLREIVREAGSIDDDGCSGGGRRDYGEGHGRTKDVSSSDVGTIEGMTSVSKDTSTRLLDRRAPERFADAEEALAAFSGDDLCTSFALDLDRVIRGEERQDGPGCGCATA